MRADVESWSIKNYKFVMEFDGGGDPNFPFVLWVYKDGNPYFDKNGVQVRKYFKEKYSRRHVNNFCSKFVNSENYRNSMINSS
ncbi:hypothetical protein [Salibacterium halotolerans]|uniref:Uncharacterized protein n=1 Tax=Salibacterium halotolerans TaxID=1884432 RepID=A0A1I5UVV8_9BACI|nr:hypothetical protein [Salibacterium halotolerans]SFP99464.1 hypothetical protein SAMN05518683_11478 [Salibacterium halotolerans]